MASILVFVSIWSALCVGDPEHLGCHMRPGQCIELSDGRLFCRPPLLEQDPPDEWDLKNLLKK